MADIRQLRAAYERMRRENEQLRSQLESVNALYGDDPDVGEFDDFFDADEGNAAPAEVDDETRNVYGQFQDLEASISSRTQHFEKQIGKAESVDDINTALRQALGKSK